MSTPTTAEAAEIIARAAGGTVVDIQRQLRWRPTWFAEVERDGEVLGMVLRGDRTDSEAFPLHHEYTFHRLMEEHGLQVPHLLDPQVFIDAGIDHPRPGEDPAMAGHRHMISRYRERKVRPDPFSEFCIGWHLRHHFAARLGNGLQFGAAERELEQLVLADGAPSHIVQF